MVLQHTTRRAVDRRNVEREYAMNDPHVVALFYNIDHGNSVNCDKAEPLVVEEKAFRLKVKDKKASFFLKDHYAEEAEARESIEEYIRNWEFAACLQGGPDSFRLNYERPEIVDRNPQTPPPGAVELYLTPVIFPPASIAVSVSRVATSYPSPPADVSVTPDVKTMYDRYLGYRRGHEPITGMAYFCYTFIKHLGKGLQAAARHFQISKNVLVKIRILSSTKGGPSGARKYTGVAMDLTGEERRFLDEAVKMIIRRVAEKANAPGKNLVTISLCDLPPCG